MPGMRPLADLLCPECQRAYYGDLAVAQALYTPLLLEQATGRVHDPFHVPWFAEWLRSSYAARSTQPLPFTAEDFRTVRRPLLLNCIDKLYGHALLKLLNAQHYIDHHPEVDVILLVPRYLRWMVPDGAAAVWTVDLPLRRGAEWNDWLAAEIARRLDAYPECMLSIALPHPHPDDLDIERFTGVAPMPESRWSNVSSAPVVTFIWREDRLWLNRTNDVTAVARKIQRKVGIAPNRLPEQRENLIVLAEMLRRECSGLRFVVVGFGAPEALPAWIEDRRQTTIDETVERQWCQLYAGSHLIIGVHGSNMLLPSAHAGAVVDLMPEDRWANMVQDLLPRWADPREAMMHCHMVPLCTGPADVGGLAAGILRNRNAMMLNMGRDNSLRARINPGVFRASRLMLKN